MKEFYIYSEKNINELINQMFIKFQIHVTSLEKIKKNNFFNQNILLIVSERFEETLKKSFFDNNNVIVFYTTNNNINKKNLFSIKTFNKNININKFIDEVTTFFGENLISYGDIKIKGEKIINNKADKETFLTSLEKDIFTVLINQQEAEKNLLLERVLKIKKETQTKTIESHLTRIRNKLLKINSKLKIISKGDKVFLS